MGCNMQNRSRKGRAGLTLVEMLIGVTLVSMLLGAIAVATHASLYSYGQNENSASADGFVRMLLMRMRREIRTAEAVDFNADFNELVITPPTNDQGITRIRYEFDSGSQSLIYHRTANGETISQALADADSPVRIWWFWVTYYTGEADGGLWYTQRAVVQMYIQDGARYRTITCSAAPRRNVEY